MASTAPSSVACGAHCRTAPAGSPAAAPATTPIAGSHSSAATPSPGRKAAASARTGTIVNRLADRRAAPGARASETFTPGQFTEGTLLIQGTCSSQTQRYSRGDQPDLV